MSTLAPPVGTAISFGWQQAADVPPGDAWLGARERVFAARLRVAARRADWRLGRFAAKQALATWHGREPFDAEILPDERGAPVAWIDNEVLPVALSLSHRAGHALCAATGTFAAVGCDIEIIEPRSEEFVADYFTARERALVAGAAARDRSLLANLVWSAKESALKARGVGLTVDTRSVEVDVPGPLDCSGWQDLSVGLVDGGEPLLGWWRCSGSFVWTVVAAR